jgi:hypothetical protein
MLACKLQRFKKRVIKNLTTMNKARKLIITTAQERDTENSQNHTACRCQQHMVGKGKDIGKN